MNIKKTILISVAALTIASSAYAMRPGPGGGGPCGETPPGPPNIEHLQEVLDLNDEQVVSLTQLFDEQKSRRSEQRKEHREMRDQMHQKLSLILTPSQLEDFKAMKRKRCHKR